MPSNSSPFWVFTLKALYSTAQGRGAAATLGSVDAASGRNRFPGAPTLPRVRPKRRPWAVEYNPFRVKTKHFDRARGKTIVRVVVDFVPYSFSYP